MNKLTLKQVRSKFKGRYIEVSKLPFWDVNDKGEALYEVRKSFKEVHENTTLAEDLGTEHAYRR